MSKVVGLKLKFAQPLLTGGEIPGELVTQMSMGLDEFSKTKFLAVYDPNGNKIHDKRNGRKTSDIKLALDQNTLERDELICRTHRT